MLEQYEKSLLAIKEPHELFAAVQVSCACR